MANYFLCCLFSGGGSLSEMLSALKEVVQWFRLGIFLSLPRGALLTIKAQGRYVEECKRLMLICWFEQDIPTWEKLIEALMEMKMYSLAVKIATKYREYNNN